jgi:uncharacterized protein YndB with AHSA1/START domain
MKRQQAQIEETLPDQVAAIRIRAPIERVWREITKIGRVQKAVYNTILETSLIPGEPLRYYNPGKSRVFVMGDIVECEPPTVFSHTYWFTTWRTGKPTLVTWRLAQDGDECIVTVTHSGWTKEHKEYGSTGKGWARILALLKALVEGGDVPARTHVAYALMGWFSFLLPERTLTTHVDAHSRSETR